MFRSSFFGIKLASYKSNLEVHMRFATISVLLSFLASSAFAYEFIHNVRPLAFRASNVDYDLGIAVYRDPKTKKQETFELSELSPLTHKRVNGVQESEVVLLDDKVCQAFYVGESGRTALTCQTGITYKDKLEGQTHKTVYKFSTTTDVIPEIPSMDCFNKKDKVILNTKIGHIEAGETVRIEAILASGEALIRRVGLFGLALVQTGRPVVYDPYVLRVKLSDLQKE